MLQIVRSVFLLLALSVAMVLGWSTRTPAHTTSLPAIADTYLKRGTPNRNQGHKPVLRVRRSG